MRKSYLEAYQSVLSETQQAKLLEVLKITSDLAGITLDQSSLSAKLEELIAQLEKPLGTPLIQYRPAQKYSKIKSSNYNTTMQEAYADLGALFNQDNVINKTIVVHRMLNDTVLTDVRASLKSISNKLKVYRLLKETTYGITDAVFGSFYKDDNQTGETTYKAYLDSDINILSLPLGTDTTALSINGLAAAEITVNRYGGGIRGIIGDANESEELAIDGDEDTFWGEVILTDEPVRQVYNGSSVFGVVAEIVIKMYRAESINHIRFSSFANYPLTISEIYYKPAPNDAWINLGVTSQSSLSIMYFNFNEVTAKEVKFVVIQPNPEIKTYKLPKRVINNAQLWQQIIDSEYSTLSSGTTYNQSIQEKLDYSDGWQAYIDASKQYSDKLISSGKSSNYIYTGDTSEKMFDAITGTMLQASDVGANALKLNLYGVGAESENEIVEVRKYEYVYGAYEIDIKRRWYLSIGEYVSPKYTVSGGIAEALLDVTEVVPSGTTVEYQLATREGEWINVLPNETVGTISKERLDVDKITHTGVLRFPCSGVPNAVYKDDLWVDAGGYSYSSGGNSIYINSDWYAGSSSYTASYTPIGTIDIIPSGIIANYTNDPLVSAVDTFSSETSRQYSVELTHYPYVNYNIINDTSEAGKSSPDFTYTDGRWLNSSIHNCFGINKGEYYDVMTVTVDGYSAENVTDYYDDIRPALTSYDEDSYPSFEYFHTGKNVYFNAPLSTREVKITYNYLNDYIQMRALFRNNTRKTTVLTPTIEDYTIKLRTL